METLRVGSLCYFDSFSGLIAGKVVGITGPSGMCSTAQSVDVQITARDSSITNWAKWCPVPGSMPCHVVPCASGSTARESLPTWCKRDARFDLLGLYASAANLLSVGGALVNPESKYYFDWQAQIDNPVSVLKGAIAHLQRGLRLERKLR